MTSSTRRMRRNSTRPEIAGRGRRGPEREVERERLESRNVDRRWAKNTDSAALGLKLGHSSRKK